MSIQYSSPIIRVNESDKSLSIPAPETTTVGGVGEFSWGAAFQPLFPYSETSLQQLVGKPVERNVKHYMCAVDALSYGSNLTVVRILDKDTAKNATCDDAKTGILVENRDAYDTLSTSAKTGLKFAAKYAGTLGNSLSVSLADSNTFDNWKYASLFSDKPGTSEYAKQVGAVNDELHVVVIDRGGLFSGIPGTILETYEFLSKAHDGKTLDLNSNYFVNKINEESDYVWFMSMPTDYDTTTHADYTTDWGTTLIDVNTGNPSKYKDLKMPDNGIDGSTSPSDTNPHIAFGGDFGGGNLGDEPGDEDYIKGWDVFKNAEETDVGLLYLGAVPDSELKIVAQHVIDKIVSVREDCVLTISPPLKTVLNKTEQEAIEGCVQFFHELNRQSSFVVLTCNWFLEYDQHTDATYWIPDNVGTAGLMARTDQTNDPWFSPAGYTRGVYKNVIKTAWNPSTEAADRMYKYSINRVSTFRGYGTVLYGDRTMITRPSALRMIGVRRLLIQLRTLIRNAARYTLFEFNDSITRQRFISLVRPYLLQVHAGRGLDSFQIVCDETNNTPQVIDQQGFVADIYIRPLYSINAVLLNFILVNNTLTFKEAGAN